jgi:hypothetical protein
MIGRLRPLAAGAALLAISWALAACGGDSGSGGGGGGGGHDSPEAAVRGAAAAMQRSSSLNALCDWVAPSQKQTCNTSLQASLQGVSANVKLNDFDVLRTEIDKNDPNKALVHVKGTITACVSGNVQGQAINTCLPVPVASAGSDTINCIRENGQWWIAAEF